GAPHDLLHLLIQDRARHAGTRIIRQAIQTPLDKTPAPLRNRLLVHAELGRDLVVVEPIRTAQHDPAPRRQPLLALWPARPPLQLLTLRRLQHEQLLRSASPRHLRLLVGCRSCTSTAPLRVRFWSDDERALGLMPKLGADARDETDRLVPARTTSERQGLDARLGHDSPSARNASSRVGYCCIWIALPSRKVITVAVSS